MDMASNVNFGQLSVVVAIIAQTSLVCIWLGKLVQRVQDIKEDTDEIKADMVRSNTCNLHRAEADRRCTAFERRLEVLERLER